MSDLLPLLAPLASLVRSLDLSDTQSSTEVLRQSFQAPQLEQLERMLRAAHAAGTLTPRKAGGIHFGRIAKASPATHECSIDVVDIDCTGAEHTHPEGEVSLCFEIEGNPRFDGHPAGWVVLPPGSHHAPTVTGGRMLIVYFLPKGAVRWGPQSG